MFGKRGSVSLGRGQQKANFRGSSVNTLFSCQFPDALRPAFSRLKERLEDPDTGIAISSPLPLSSSISPLLSLFLLPPLPPSSPGVQSAAVSVICELARKNPRNYLSLAPTFFKLMTTSTNNWMLIKIIKLVGQGGKKILLGSRGDH